MSEGISNFKVATHALEVVSYIDDQNLSATEKIAVLRSAADTIQNTIQAEAMQVALFEALKPKV